MNVPAEIAERLARLSPHLQEQVLLFVSSLESSRLKGERGASLARFAGSIDEVSAREMTQAIEEECERTDAREW